jgi:hypothetical protein
MELAIEAAVVRLKGGAPVPAGVRRHSSLHTYRSATPLPTAQNSSLRS